MKKLLSILFIVWIPLFVFTGCNKQNKVYIGDNVSVVYTATFSDGELFEQNTKKTPLLFTVGEGQVIQWLDETVVGMKIGKKKTVTLKPQETYGSLYNENLIQNVGKLIFDTLEITPEEGTLQQLDNLKWIIRGIKTDDNGNEFVLFDINPKQTRDTLKYEIIVLAKEQK